MIFDKNVAFSLNIAPLLPFWGAAEDAAGVRLGVREILCTAVSCPRSKLLPASIV